MTINPGREKKVGIGKTTAGVRKIPRPPKNPGLIDQFLRFMKAPTRPQNVRPVKLPDSFGGGVTKHDGGDFVSFLISLLSRR